MGAVTEHPSLWELDRRRERDPLAGAVVMGADIGQRVDPTAIAVVQTQGYDRLPYNPAPEWFHEVRYMARLPLGTSYVAVVQRLADVAHGIINQTGGELPLLYVDATGVGLPIVDMLTQANVQAQIVPVFFTHGDRRVLRTDKATGRPFISLGKAWLVSRLQGLLQDKRVRLPNTSEARALGKELLDYEIHIDDNANDKYGAFKVGAHDDLVTALGLATQLDTSGSGHFDDQSSKGAAILPARF